MSTVTYYTFKILAYSILLSLMFFLNKYRLNIIVYRAIKKTKNHFKQNIYSDYSIVWSDIAPHIYMVVFIFSTDNELKKASNSGLTNQINEYFISQLKKLKYPVEHIKNCTFASKEDCDRKTNGNWYYYFK